MSSNDVPLIDWRRSRRTQVADTEDSDQTTNPSRRIIVSVPGTSV